MLKTLRVLEKHDGAVAGDFEHAAFDRNILRALRGLADTDHPLFKGCHERLVMREHRQFAVGAGKGGGNRRAVEARLAHRGDNGMKSRRHSLQFTDDSYRELDVHLLSTVNCQLLTSSMPPFI